MKSDVIVIGGGVIGCSVALRLAQSGLEVAVIERGRVGCEASRAAAGMLSPQIEASGPDPFFDLCVRSRSLYRSFAEELTYLSGIDVQYKSEGTLCLMMDEKDEADIKKWAAWQSQAGMALERIAADAARSLEPAVSRAAVGAALVANDHQVENRRLMDALAFAIKQTGVEMIEGAEVESLLIERDSVSGVVCNGQQLYAGRVVIAAGCWSSRLLEPIGFTLKIIPARGQMVAVKSQSPLISHVVHSSKCYLVPRRDNRILIGATVEYAGFEKKVTAGGINSLLSAAIEAIPEIGSLEVVESWCGLRPDTADHLPVMGPSGVENLLLATGHFRNGILLAPITADLISQSIASGRTPPELEPFGIDRFESPANLLEDAAAG